MGFAVPAAIGAKVSRPDSLVRAIDGDGCFQSSRLSRLVAPLDLFWPPLLGWLNGGMLFTSGHLEFERDKLVRRGQ